MTRKNRKITKYRRPQRINIGIIIFGFIFVYIIISVILYLFSNKITVYEVTKGSLATNYRYNAFAVRSEEVIAAKKSGSIVFYASEGSKVAVDSLIYTIDESGTLSDLISSDELSDTLDSDLLSNLQGKMTEYSYDYSDFNFSDVYAFKTTIQENILASINNSVLAELENSDADLSTINTYYAKKAGIIEYYTDGYEDTTISDFDVSVLDEESEYAQTKLNSESSIEKSSDVYKLVTSENWNLVFEADSELINKLEDTSNIEIEFLKDDTTTWAGVSTFSKGDKQYVNLSLTNSCIRYASDRYLEIELLIDDDTGLKIPTSALTDKDFYVIPIDYLTNGGDSDEEGFLVETYDEDNTVTVEFTDATIYYSDDTYCYVDTNDFSLGSYIVMPDTNDRYQISETLPLTGVYNINKGYAVFKQVDIINQNKEYCIVESGTDYGLALYDRIVLDSSTINENDIID